MKQHSNLSGIMEAETISKNEASSISPMSRGFVFRKVRFPLLILLLIAFCSTTVIAQTEILSEEFMEQVGSLGAQINEHMVKEDYQTAEKLINETFALFNRMSEENQNNYNWLENELYYVRACILSLQGKIEAAVNDFEKAVESGFSNYSRADAEVHLGNIRADQRFIVLMESIRDKSTFLYILRQTGKYQSADTSGLPRFTYETATSNNLKNVRELFKLDSIAGQGDEISKIKNLLKWVQTNIRHDGSNYALCEFTSIDIYNYHKSTGKGVNCRHLAIVLNEFYLAMGFKSRYVTCMSKDETDAHVVNSVYSTTLNKWLWMDPTVNAYLKDENGTLLSIEEVRERLIEDRPLILNDDANWNNRTKYTKEMYLDDWMSKFLYWFSCPSDSRFNPESRYHNTNQTYIYLVPLGYKPSSSNIKNVITHDAAYFWEH